MSAVLCARRCALAVGLCLVVLAGPAEAARTMFGMPAFPNALLPQWRSAIDGLDAALAAFDACAGDRAGCSVAGLGELVAQLDGMRSLARPAQVAAVNHLANARPYRSDQQAYGRNDHWAGPLEFLERSGDCEDYALLKYAALAWLGVPDRDLRVVLVRALPGGTAHAVLAVESAGGRLILDDAVPEVRSEAGIHHYRPVAAFNRQGRWGYLSRPAGLSRLP